MQQAMSKFYEQVFFPALDQHEVKVVLHAGDFLDRRKYCNIGTARFIYTAYSKPLADRGIEQHILTGNHDIYYRTSTEVTGVEELYRHDANVHIYTQPTEITVGGCNILMLPWLADNNRAASLQAIQTTNSSIILGHMEISGYQMYRGLPNNEGLDAKLFDRFELVMSGHYHHRTVTHPVVYLGAPLPFIWSDYKDPRGFHLFDTETHELTYIENPHSLFVKIFYDDKDQKGDYIKDLVQAISAPGSEYHDAYVKVIVKSRENPYWFDIMMDHLYKVNVQDVLVIDDIIVDDADETDDETAPDLDTLTLMKDYIESLSISCDRNELFDYLQAKYHEAMATSQSARLS